MGSWGLEKRNPNVSEGAMSVLCTVVTVPCTVQPGWALQVSVGSGQSSGSHVSQVGSLNYENWFTVNSKIGVKIINQELQTTRWVLEFQSIYKRAIFITQSFHVYIHWMWLARSILTAIILIVQSVSQPGYLESLNCSSQRAEAGNYSKPACICCCFFLGGGSQIKY